MLRPASLSICFALSFLLTRSASECPSHQFNLVSVIAVAALRGTEQHLLGFRPGHERDDPAMQMGQ
jgi:hypothetical protein